MAEHMITTAAEILKDKGFTQISLVADTVDTGTGITYNEFERNGKTYYIRAKEYVYEGKAPFGAEMVTDALADSALLIIYFDDLEQCFVFDPGYVENYGKRNTGRSKRSDERTWVEVELDTGAVLDHYLAGDVKPTTSRPRTNRKARAENTVDASLDFYT